MEKRNLKRTERGQQALFHEDIEEAFTINFGCPHCNKTLNISLAKMDLRRIKG